MKLVNRHIFLFIIVFSTFLGVLKFTMLQHVNVISYSTSSKESSIISPFEKSLNLLLIEDQDIPLGDVEDTKHHFSMSYFYVLIILPYLSANINITNILFLKNQKKHIRERDKYQLYLSLQVP